MPVSDMNLPSAPSRDLYDVIVIGAGPAGLCATIHILSAESKPAVLLVDKQIPWLRPIACAEGVGRLGFHQAITVDPAWIRCVIGNACFHAPDGSTITYSDPNKGYIINRARMQQDLTLRCIEQGADATFDRRVVEVTPPAAGIRAVRLDNGTIVRGRVVIDASGPVSAIGKQEKIAWRSTDLEPAFFALVKGISCAPGTVDIFMSKKTAPGGYAWVFPREEKEANAGLLVGREYSGSVNIRTLLDSFIATQFPGGRVVRCFAGAIPCGCRRRTIAIHGLIKAGDAASTLNPISRAGIVEAMHSGGLAGDCAIKMLGASTVKQLQRLCASYESAWFRKLGKRHGKLAEVKKSLARVPDADYNQAARALQGIPREELTMSRIFRVSLGRFPRLVWAMRHLM
jgi:flavin-dependent dehydrogenase